MTHGIQIDNFLCGPRIQLTTLTPDDAATIAGWNQHIGYARLLNTDVYRPSNETSLRQWLEKVNDEPKEIHFAIRLVESQSLIGTLGFVELEWANQTAELYIGLGDPNQWGQGYGREAMEIALRYGFREVNLHRIQVTVIAYNERAIALYERLGFVREGVFRQFGLRDGQRYDMLLYGLLRDEWTG